MNVAAFLTALLVVVAAGCGDSAQGEIPTLETGPDSPSLSVTSTSEMRVPTTTSPSSVGTGAESPTATTAAPSSVPTTAERTTTTTTTGSSNAPAPTIDYDEPTEGFESEEPNQNNEQFITYEPDT